MPKRKVHERENVWLIVRQLSKKGGWWDVSFVLQDLAKAIPIIRDNGLPILTENNFQTPLPFYLDPLVYWYLDYLLDPTPCIKITPTQPIPPHPPFYLELESK